MSHSICFYPFDPILFLWFVPFYLLPSYLLQCLPLLSCCFGLFYCILLLWFVLLYPISLVCPILSCCFGLFYSIVIVLQKHFFSFQNRFLNMFSIKGRTALITGCSSGLGAHFAKVLYQNGLLVVVSLILLISCLFQELMFLLVLAVKTN